MIAKINQLQTSVKNKRVKSLCESAKSVISSALYNNVSNEAKYEIERVALNNLFTGLKKYTSDTTINEWLQNQKRVYSIKNIGVRKAVSSLLEKEAKYDATLSSILEGFRDKIEQEVPEILLYEAFISAMGSFDHLPSVNTEISDIVSKVSKYKNDIDITKILEVMKETRSNYLLPLIEDVISNYLNEKTEQNRSFLKETLVKFSYDPFIRDIINIITLDATQLQLEYANSECSITDKLFSPIQYLGENEVLFNIKGTYYVKKGNNINRVSVKSVSNINESFRKLCDIINLPNIEVSKNDIKIYVDKDNAIITESEIYVNGNKFNDKQLKESASVSKWGGNEFFYNVIHTLNENFNEIADLDFVKRVHLKENEGYAADIFKLRDNIFITTFDPINAKSTFYRNINPIQAESIMMEHMRFDVSKTFNDILPNKEKILSEIEQSKIEYTSYINELKEKINTFKSSYEDNNVTQNVVEALCEELEEVRNDYKQYLDKVEAFTSVSEDLHITVQDDSSGKSYTVAVPTGALAAKGSDGMNNDENPDNFGTVIDTPEIEDDVDVELGASNTITYDDDESELLSDEPSDPNDMVDLGADEVEAHAEKIDAETELSKADDTDDDEDFDLEDEDSEDFDLDDEDSEDFDLEDEDSEDFDLEDEDSEEFDLEDEDEESIEEPETKQATSKRKKVFLKRPKK